MKISPFLKVSIGLAVCFVSIISQAKSADGDWTKFFSGMQHGCETTANINFQDDFMRFELPDMKRVQSYTTKGTPPNFTSLALLKNVTAFGSNLNSISYTVNNNQNTTTLTFSDDKFMKSLPTFFYPIATSSNTIKLKATARTKSFYNKADDMTYTSQPLGYKGVIKNGNYENVKIEMSFNPQQKTITCLANF